MATGGRESYFDFDKDGVSPESTLIVRCGFWMNTTAKLSLGSA